MDTNVLPQETDYSTTELHTELALAADKVDRQDARAIRNDGYGATVGGMAITNSYHAKVTQAVTEKLLGPRPRTNSIEFRVEKELRQLSAEVIALCILQAGLSNVGARQAAALENLGQALNDELWAHNLLQTNKKLAHKINKAVKDRYGSVELRKAAAKRLAAKGDDEGNSFSMKDWSNTQLVHAGQWAMNILLAAMPEVFELPEPAYFKAPREWGITDHAHELVKQAVTEVVIKSPVYQPRTERPLDWTQFVSRVAEDDRTVARAPLLRTGYKDIISSARHAISNGQMAPALRAVNVLQSVPFKINTWIMDVINECYAKGIAVEGLPRLHSLEVPKRMPDAEFRKLSVENRKLLSKTIRGLKKANRANDVDTTQYMLDMKTAERLAPVDSFYCPMNMDWRGRVYGLTHFNFQREDRVRAMFLFTNGEPIGEEGIYWLKVHVANSGAFEKVDKKPLEDRIKWVDENLELITDYVRRPLYNTAWTKADSPFLFLAACRELVAAIVEGPAYVCHMPVSFDGSCSGLQHLAAMTLACEGSLVNLTDNAIPADVYQTVADLAKKMIEADLNSDEPFGKPDEDRPERKTVAPLKRLARIALAYGVDRKLVKRNVMTFAYSSKEFGMGEQVYEDTMEPLELKLLKGEITEHPFGDSEDEWRLAARYLAKRVLAAIKSVVKLPAEAMEFMQTLAKKMAHEGKPLRWVSPAGIPCINRYHDYVTDVVELWCHDKGIKQRTQVTVATDIATPIAKDKAAAGISPNFVHSHDAGHLLLTVVNSAAEGIVDIATVHDSFGCLPSRATRFNQIIRETFLRMYTEHDVLSELLESARANLDNPEKLPELPSKGALNLKEILNARYAFA